MGEKGMRTWTPLFSSIVDSSVWLEPDHVCKVWITLLALKDADHVYRGTAFALAVRCHKPEREVVDALSILEARDGRRDEAQENDGRRIKRVGDGWLVLNGEKYRRELSDAARRDRWRRAQEAYRRRGQVPKKSVPLVGEERFIQAEGKGDDAEADRIAGERVSEEMERDDGGEI
jgi:hypothetical protein